MFKKLFFAVSLCFVIFSAQAQQKLTAETLWKFGRIGNVQLSPDGKWLLYSVSVTDLEANKSPSTLYLMPSAGGAAKAITASGDQVIQPRFSPDGKKIGFLSSQSGSMQMWEMNTDGSGKTQVTNVEDGIDLFEYSPKSNYILLAKDVKVDQTIKEKYPDLQKTTGRVFDGLNLRHWDTYEDEKYSHVMYLPYNNGKAEGTPVDIMKGERFDSPNKPFGGSEQVTFSADGHSIVYACKKETGTAYAVSTNTDLYMYNISGGTTTNLTSSNKGYDLDPKFSPDGKFMAYLSMERAGYESDKNRLMLYDFTTKSASELTTGFDQSVDQFSWSPDGKVIYFSSAVKGTKQLYSYTFQPKKKEQNIKQLTSGDHDFFHVEASMNGKTPVIVGSKMSISQPTELYLINPENKNVTQLTQVNTDLLKNVKMGAVRARWTKSTDGKMVHSWVIYPPDFDSTKKYPALLYCQGGPQSTVSQFFSPRWNFQMMAAKGYIVVAPNRRGLPSFGQEWNDAIIGDYGGQPMQDLLAAIDDVSAEKYVDKDRLGAVGASFGGYTVFWLAGNHNNRFKAFIAHCGMFNMESWYGSTEEMFFANNDQKGPYWENPAPYQKFSPHRYAKNWNTPILIIHNEKDYRVPITQGFEAFTAAQLQGVPSRLLYFPDENHWVLKPQNSVLWQREFFNWLDEYLKPGKGSK